MRAAAIDLHRGRVSCSIPPGRGQPRNVNPYVYSEYRRSSRYAPGHFRRTVVTGLVPVVLAVILWYSRFPHGGPGLYSVAGLGAAGLLMLAGVRMAHEEPNIGRLARALVSRSDTWYPAYVLATQNLFIALTALLLWFTICDLGFAASWMQHSLLVLLLLLSPVRRIMAGTEPAHPGPWRELLSEGLRYVNACTVAFFAAGCLTVVIIPPDEPLTRSLPAGVVLAWLPAVLVAIGSVILFIDHLLRKMPAPPPPEEKDELE